MKRVLLIHLPAQFIGRGLQKGFAENGFGVIELDWQGFKLKRGVEELRRYCIFLAKEHKPDLIFMQVQNPLIIDIPTVKRLQEIAPVVNYSFDCRSKEESEWYYDMARYITYTAFSNTVDVENCKDFGNFNCGVLQSSCDMDFYQKQTVEPKEDIVFVGQNYLNTNLNFPKSQERIDLVDFLKRTYGSRFKAYGLGWIDSTLLTPEKEKEVYSSAKIAITHNNFERGKYQSDRMFRASCSGCLVVPQYYEGIKDDFQNILTWSNFGELKYIIHNLLDNPNSIEILQQKQEQEVRENHSYAARVRQLINDLNNLYDGNFQSLSEN